MRELCELRAELSEWLTDTRALWTVNLRLVCAGHEMRLIVPGMHRLLSIRVTPLSLRVSVGGKGHVLDTLLWLDMRPRRTQTGFVCLLCGAKGGGDGNEFHTSGFPSLKALRRDHLLEPFRIWWEKHALRSAQLVLQWSPGASQARLLPFAGLASNAQPAAEPFPPSHITGINVLLPLFDQGQRHV